VRTTISGLPPLTRKDERERIRARLGDHGVCLLVGESGSGKSAPARDAAGRYERVVWLAPETLDGDSLARLERGLDVRHPLVEVLRVSARPCLLVLDGAEAYSEPALRLAARLIRELRAAPSPGHVLLT